MIIIFIRQHQHLNHTYTLSRPDPIKRRKILIVVNPFGGRKKAPSIYKEKVQPILAKTHIDADVIATQHAGHASEIGSTLDLDTYEAVVTISGDGLLHELINGLMLHKAWHRAIKTPVGIIQGGTGNAMAQSLGLYDIYHAVLNVIKFDVRPLDLFAVQQEGEKIRYGFLALFWGLIADVDIGSEAYRWAGQARVTVSALVRITNPAVYPGRLAYLEWHPDTHPVPDHAMPNDEDHRPHSFTRTD